MEEYSIENSTLTLIDTELNLSIKEHFALMKIPQNLQENLRLSDGSFLKVIYNEEGIVEEAYLEKDGKRHGQSFLYYSSGQKKMEQYYDQGVLHGPVTFYSEKEIVLSIIWYVRGKKQGKSKRFYPSAKPYCILRFYNNKPHGNQEYFYENGKMKSLISYQNGVLDGETQLFNTKGETEREYLFSNGKKISS